MSFKVLVVDDSKSARQTIAAILEPLENLSVYESESGFDALKILPRHRFDLIITDLNMPDINGLELINFVKKNPNYKETPLIIVSAASTENERRQGLALGAAQCLEKPFDPKLLTGLVRSYMKL